MFEVCPILLLASQGKLTPKPQTVHGRKKATCQLRSPAPIYKTAQRRYPLTYSSRQSIETGPEPPRNQTARPASLEEQRATFLFFLNPKRQGSPSIQNFTPPPIPPAIACHLSLFPAGDPRIHQANRVSGLIKPRTSRTRCVLDAAVIHIAEGDAGEDQHGRVRHCGGRRRQGAAGPGASSTLQLSTLRRRTTRVTATSGETTPTMTPTQSRSDLMRRRR
jgi:hypothetical protein